MLLSELIARLEDVTVERFTDGCVRSVEENSKSVLVGSVFVARCGVRFDGNDFIDEAVSRGAVAVVTEKRDVKKMPVTTIFSKNAGKTMAEIAKALYSEALCNMTIIGITGTKGKTTTLKILSECILSKEKAIVTIGTLGVEICTDVREVYTTENTTPNSAFIYKTLYRAHTLGVRYAVIEVSSQALSEYRVYGIPFTVCIFTNISRDHIGANEHKSFDDYLSAKRSLFSEYNAGFAVVNADDKNYALVTDGCPRVIKVGSGCEYEYASIGDSLGSTCFSLNGKIFTLSLGGAFNGMNAALALCASSLLLGCDISEFSECLKSVTVPGRYEVYSLGAFKVVIDFAHNGHSVASLLESVRQHTEGRLILVFGSVGERCRSRRAELALAAERLADFSVITADNPGREPTLSVCNEIFSHFTDRSRAVIVTDRERAIIYAISLAKAGDTVLLVGKGQENYQLTAEGRVYFSERAIIEKLGAVRDSDSSAFAKK